MEKTKISKLKKLGLFIKKNLYYILLAAVIITLMTIALVKTNDSMKLEENVNNLGQVEVSTAKTEDFQVPVANIDIIRDYSTEDFVNYTSLGYYAVHKAVDFSGAISSNVYSIAAGTVEKVETTSNKGTVVKVKHDNGFVSVYASLDENTSVKEGDVVKKGSLLGQMSSSMQDEAELGVHLHFELLKNNVIVDPNLYLNISNK